MKKTTKKAKTPPTSKSKSARRSKVLVGIIMGSDSDLRIMQGAAECLEEFGVPYEVKIVSAHRTPEAMYDYAATAHERGLRVIIAGAGGAAHLPGMVASLTLLPVIGVPVIATKLDGLDALLSVVQMPKGVPVATVAIDNAYNAGLLAVRMISAQGDEKLFAKLGKYRQALIKKIRDANKRLRTR